MHKSYFNTLSEKVAIQELQLGRTKPVGDPSGLINMHQSNKTEAEAFIKDPTTKERSTRNDNVTRLRCVHYWFPLSFLNLVLKTKFNENERSC